MKETFEIEFCFPPPREEGVHTDMISPLSQGIWQWTFLIENEKTESGCKIIIGKCVVSRRANPKLDGYVMCGAFVSVSDKYGYKTSNTLTCTKRRLKQPHEFFKLKCSSSFPNELNCRLVLTIDNETGSVAERPKRSTAASSAALTCSFDSLLQSGLLSDVILCTEGQDIPAHQCILAARSDFFKAKFKPEWNGKTVNLDVPLSVLQEMLRYMYTGSFGEDVDVIQLLVAGDMYLVTDLCDEIKGRLEEGLELGKPIASVCDMLKMSVTFNSQSLRSVVLKYMKNHHHEVLKSKEWNEFQIANRQVAAEAVLDMFNIPDK